MRKRECNSKKIDYVQPTLNLFNPEDCGLGGMGCAPNGSYATSCTPGGGANACNTHGSSAGGSCSPTGNSNQTACEPNGPGFSCEPTG